MAIKIKHIEPQHLDERGSLTEILDCEEFPIKAILRITSKAGTVRANHYHKKDSHYIYVESGKAEYSERPADKPEAPLEKVLMGPGDIVLTGPKVAHAVKFLEDTVFYAYTTEPRDQELYEKEIVRVKLVE